MLITCVCSTNVPYEMFREHASVCIQKSTECPLDCGTTMKSLIECGLHLKVCHKAYVNCD